MGEHSDRESTAGSSSPILHETSPLLPKASNEERVNGTLAVAEPPPIKFVLVLICLYIGSFLAAFDMTVVATLLTPISSSFDSFSSASWIATAYFVATSASQPLYGRLTDIFGRRAGVLFSNTLFLVGTLLCAVAPSMGALIAGRVVAGIGGGGLTTVAVIITSDLIPLRKRGIFQGLGNIVYGIGSASGGVVGGYINDSWGWRTAFYCQIPVIAISAILAAMFLHIPTQRGGSTIERLKRVDFMGSFTLVSTLVLILLALNMGGNIVPWNHPVVYVGLPLGAVFFAAFAYNEEKRAAEPIIPVRLVLTRTIGCGCLANWFMTMGVFGQLFYLPIYYQVRGFTPTQAGERVLPYSAGIAIGSMGAGIIARVTGKYYWTNILGHIMFLGAAGAIAAWDLATPTWQQFSLPFLSGSGYAVMLTMTLLALIASADHAHQAVITAASYAFRATGSTLGVAFASAIFQNVLRSQLLARLGDKGPEARDIIEKVRQSLDQVPKIPLEYRQDVLDSYILSCRLVFASTIAFALLALVASVFIREHILHSTIDRR